MYSRTWDMVESHQNFMETWGSGVWQAGGWVFPSFACGLESDCPHAGLFGNPAHCSAGPAGKVGVRAGGALQVSSSGIWNLGGSLLASGGCGT